MFNCCEFVFDNVSSKMFGLEVYDLEEYSQANVAFGNKASIIEAHTTGRYQNIHYGVDFNTQPLEFTITFGSPTALDRYEMQEIALWLTGHQDYKWLQICQPDLLDVYYHAIVTELLPISLDWNPYMFQATIRCDSPYAYSQEWTRSYSIGSSATSILFQNMSSTHEYLTPEIQFTPYSGVTSLTITNASDNNRQFQLTGIPSGAVVKIDNKNGIIQNVGTGSTNLYSGFNLNFFRMIQGDNELSITGRGTLELTGRFMYNVAA